MLTIGILGASGFIGSRMVELLHAEPTVTVRPIVRNPASLASWAGLALDGRVAHALDASALQQAFQGCEVIVHSVTGNPGLIRGSVDATYQAAQRAGVRRIIYLSSMCVHGQAPAPGTHEATPLTKPQPFPYNSAKIDAERSLLAQRSSGSVEVVIFRPGIVFGPRSPRVVEVATELLNGTAYLVNGGKGICNTTYVDNLVHAVKLAIQCKTADNQAFFIGEPEPTTWADFYHTLATGLGIHPAEIATVAPVAPPSTSLKQKLVEPVRDSVLVQTLLASISDSLKQSIKETVSQNKTHSLPTAQQLAVAPQTTTKPERVVTYELSLLHQSPYKLPYDKACQILGYEPILSLPQAYQRTIAWLISAGYTNR
jgi:2-alkyl-3-oxoalkanoate reductase